MQITILVTSSLEKKKNKIRLLVNKSLDEFLKETIILNIISLDKTRMIIVKKSVTTNYGNYYFLVNNIFDILKLVQLLVKDAVFKKKTWSKMSISNV